MDSNHEQQVRERAFQLWQGEGMVSGRDLDHWIAAESQVKSMMSNAPVEAAAPAKPKRTRSTKAKK